MRVSFRVVLTWAERIAAAVLIAAPAIRKIMSEVDMAKAESACIRLGDK